MHFGASSATHRTHRTGSKPKILTRGSDFVPTRLTGVSGEPCDWQTAMKRAIRSAIELRRMLRLPPADDTDLDRDFPTFVPREFIARMQFGDPDDPLLRQVMPTDQENLVAADYTADPVGDLGAIPIRGILHKYDRRALMIASGVCGVHCRYCFRREFPYAENNLHGEQWGPALNYLRRRPDIDEVILSGGDPLTLVDESLDKLVSQIEQVEHVRRLRIHTRMPIVIPQRVTDTLVDRLARSRLAVWMVVHSNHANELNASVFDVLDSLIDRGIPLLNQTVLLRGVNDNADALIELCRRLVDHRVLPYYLHQLDRVRGAAHFEVPLETGRDIMNQIRAALPGYAVPQYVCEQAGQAGKIPISDSDQR